MQSFQVRVYAIHEVVIQFLCILFDYKSATNVITELESESVI